MLPVMSTISQKTRTKVASQPAEKATFLVSSVTVTSCEVADASENVHEHPASEEEVRASALAKAKARWERRAPKDRRQDAGEMLVVGMLPPSDLDWTRGLTTAEIVAGMTQRAAARRATSAESADKQ